MLAPGPLSEPPPAHAASSSLPLRYSSPPAHLPARSASVRLVVMLVVERPWHSPPPLPKTSPLASPQAGDSLPRPHDGQHTRDGQHTHAGQHTRAVEHAPPAAPPMWSSAEAALSSVSATTTSLVDTWAEVGWKALIGIWSEADPARGDPEERISPPHPPETRERHGSGCRCAAGKM